MYAIVRIGGRQYRVEKDMVIDVEKLPYDVDAAIEFDEILMSANGEDVAIGSPVVEGAKVKATVVDQYRARKVLVWKYRPKQRYRRLKGHRQYYTRLRIDEIIS